MKKIKIYTSLSDAIRDLFGNERRITGRQPVYGGDINSSCKITLDDQTTLFMKSNRPDALPNFEAEAFGLETIAAAGCIRVPQLLGLGTDPEGFAFLLMEFADSGRRHPDKAYWSQFAENLANLHKIGAKDIPQFGFPENNYIGHTKQINTWHENWITFFRDCRLAPQFEMASGYFEKSERRHITQLLDHLDQYLIEPDAPSLLHGDLWAGNVMTGSDGTAWLIDPAAYYGHAEADLAMTELFGGFPQTFYRRYQECMHLEAGYPDRRELYNLYHLLNHLNLFGSSYLGSVQRILKRYSS